MSFTIRKTRRERNFEGLISTPKKNQFTYKMANIIIVGNKKIRPKISDLEKNFNIMLLFTEANMLSEIINSKTIAIIVDENEVSPKDKSYLETLLSKYIILPIFYLSRTVKKSNFYTSLYSKGLQGVINWPKEAKSLHHLVIESIRPHPIASGRSKGDKKLADMVKSHLVLNGNYKSIKVKVIEGFVFLEGSVKSLFEKELIESECSKVLGVKRCISKNIKVRESKKTTDKELVTKIKMYIAHILGDKKRSMSVKVKNKVVTLVGSSSNNNDILNIEEFAMKQLGVQDVIHLVKLAPSLVVKNVKKAKFLELKIKEVFDGVKYITISIYGEYAEVSGTVRFLADKVLVEKYLLKTLPLKRIVNKLYIEVVPI
jgi:osmotically-inducible protein OsmY